MATIFRHRSVQGIGMETVICLLSALAYEHDWGPLLAPADAGAMQSQSLRKVTTRFSLRG